MYPYKYFDISFYPFWNIDIASCLNITSILLFHRWRAICMKYAPICILQYDIYLLKSILRFSNIDAPTSFKIIILQQRYMLHTWHSAVLHVCIPYLCKKAYQFENVLYIWIQFDFIYLDFHYLWLLIFFVEYRLFSFESNKLYTNVDDVALKIRIPSGLPLGTTVHSTAYVSFLLS